MSILLFNRRLIQEAYAHYLTILAADAVVVGVIIHVHFQKFLDFMRLPHSHSTCLFLLAIVILMLFVIYFVDINTCLLLGHKP